MLYKGYTIDFGTEDFLSEKHAMVCVYTQPDCAVSSCVYRQFGIFIGEPTRHNVRAALAHALLIARRYINQWH